MTVRGNYTLKGLSYGLHNLTVYANDTIGNMGASDRILFTVVEPFSTKIVIASVIIVAVVCISLLACFKKRKH